MLAATALIADDEPLLRQSLRRQLATAWPQLSIVAEARNGREAIEQFDALRPAVCFLDVQMPGLSGLEAARAIGSRAHLVFVTAFSDYAVQAFEQGVLDYLVKPLEPERLAATVARLQQRLAADAPAAASRALIEHLAARLAAPLAAAPQRLRWLRASLGDTLRLIAVEQIVYLRAEDKYTVVAWRETPTAEPAQALLRTPLKDLLAELDPEQFVQVHRSAAVNLQAISHLVREGPERARIHLRDCRQQLPVSRRYLAQFRQM